MSDNPVDTTLDAPTIRFIDDLARHEAERIAAYHYPEQRPARVEPASERSRIVVHTDAPKQLITGIGFEIMSDSIGSGNLGIPEETTSVPHDLTPAERQRLYREMLSGFRYCRLAGGLFVRGTDAERKHLRPRWPTQFDELREMIEVAGIEGVSYEYWSPQPYWKTSGSYIGIDHDQDGLRCFGPDFADDPEYHGDVDRFLADFAASRVQDLRTLDEAGIPVAMWGMQNEPFFYSTWPGCSYRPEDYVRAFQAVAPAVRAYNPRIAILADTGLSWDFRFIRPVLDDPAHHNLVDILVMHLVGSDSKHIRPPSEPTGKPRMNNEFEYLQGPATPARCLNTVQNIMNWFQLADAPSWFWIHALKPLGHEEASGYSLGLWQPHGHNGTNLPELPPGHWTWNPYNWHAVGSFVRHMPWDCRSVTVEEPDGSDDDLRVCAFTRPDGKLTVALSNRSFRSHTYHVETNRGAEFRGFRYTPDSAGEQCRGVPIGTCHGPDLSIEIPDMAWEFWEEV
ncbi:hypothetical protein [Nocardia sp. CDC160]|uniref:hypothetical protein n=1 Tax=Nocardia sp. CDC160 TaxID=3112166 RepID=UPI002DBF4966|nr:hypothetical protein [Nocardia sp. CDC160]MEC3920263.1 hypothetical protein [Nocardia sp. CDC160]